jgi:hypothetical protein
MNMVRLCCVGLMALTSVQGSCQEEPNSISSDRYALVVKKAPALQEGLFTYTVCLQLPKGDRVSSVFGTDMHPFELSAPAGVFNSPFNAGWSASGINPNFFKLMPEIQDDSFATIGLRTGARISGLQGAEDPTMVQDPGAPWAEFFTEEGAQTLRVNTHTGGAYFVLRTAANGAPVNGEVLLMQVTTSGGFSGALNIQVFPESEGYDQIRWRTTFDGPGEFRGTFID